MPDELRFFYLWLQAAGYRPDTSSRALRVIAHYLRSCDGHDWRSRTSALKYLAEAAGRVKRITLLNYRKDLDLYFRFAMSEGLVTCNPLDGIPRPRPSLYERERDSPQYTEKDIERLLRVCPGWTWLGLRDSAIIRTLWDTPLRASELCGLTILDIDWIAEEIKIRDGKGGVAYSSPFRVDCGLAIQRYLSARPYKSTHLYIEKDGRPLSRHGLEQMLRRVSKRAGWTHPCAPHYFRHNYRMRLRALGLDDTDISALLGHRSVTPTQGYGRRVARELAKKRYRARMGGAA